MVNHKNIFKNAVLYLAIAMSAILITGCKQGAVSEKPPIHVNPNMDSQNRYDAQEKSLFFADGKVNRNPVEGTVALSEGYDDEAYYFGISSNGDTVQKSPVAIREESLKRGQDRYNIYCAPCHSRVGDAKGIIVNRGFLPPPTFHQDRIRNFPDGRIFDVITKGYRNMPSYKHQIPVNDRWAIVGYVRALQRSQNANLQDIPQEKRAALK